MTPRSVSLQSHPPLTPLLFLLSCHIPLIFPTCLNLTPTSSRCRDHPWFRIWMLPSLGRLLKRVQSSVKQQLLLRDLACGCWKGAKAQLQSQRMGDGPVWPSDSLLASQTAKEQLLIQILRITFSRKLNMYNSCSLRFVFKSPISN